MRAGGYPGPGTLRVWHDDPLVRSSTELRTTSMQRADVLLPLRPIIPHLRQARVSKLQGPTELLTPAGHQE